MWQNMIHLWKLFKIAELTEVMRQRGDVQLINLLNKVRVASLNDLDDSLLRSRFVLPTDKTYPIGALHIFAENAPVKFHNAAKFMKNGNISSHIDEYPNNINVSQAIDRNQSETGGFATLLEIPKHNIKQSRNKKKKNFRTRGASSCTILKSDQILIPKNLMI